jgi:DNA-binding transcriptional MocR family regulator
MLLLRLDPESTRPAYLQIRDQIIALVDEGTLRPGDRLPPTRTLGESVGVHRSTVVRAYDEIRALGYLESRSGSYSTIRRRARVPETVARREPESGPVPSAVDWAELATEQARGAHLAAQRLADPKVPGDTIDLERLAADPALAPAAELRRCLKQVLLRGSPAALDYTEPAGWPPLREVVSMRLRSHGISVSAEEILITSGAQQALDLALRMLTRPGEAVVVEAPTYSGAHALLRLHGLTPIEIPVHRGGMDLRALEWALERRSARLVYTMPSFHNPTGVTTDQAHRERLLDICERMRVPILEDAFEEEMKYLGKAVLPIKSIDAKGLVLYVGTFSKIVFPGLRVGWIAAPRQAISLLTSIQHASCLAVNTLAQAAVERFCTSGELQAYLRRVHRVYRRRMQAVLDGLRRHMPAEIRWTRPSGGYTLWLTLPGRGEDERLWCNRLARAGVRAAPGSRFFGVAPARPHLRLSISCADEDQIEEGCQRLGRALSLC